ncbi:MAG TPA: AmmeMemoRadiSam system protein B [Acidimicrobiales bacterium]
MTGSGWVRKPAVAGLFYPAEPDALRAAVSGHLARAPSPDGAAGPLALIAPHAGYRYSGATAGAAYRTVAERQGGVERVVLVGPAHRVPVPGVGASTARAWRTPLGEVPVDVDTCRRLVAEGAAVEADDAHAPEHSLEVHLPFLTEVLGTVPIVPLVVGRCPARRVAHALERAWDDDATLVVVSSDLSHYLSEDQARERDERTRSAIVEGRAGDIGPHDACGAVPIAGLLLAARARHMTARTLAVATSAAVSGDESRVVGYASFGFAPPRPLGPAERTWLLDRARAAIAHEAVEGSPDPLEDGDVPERLRLPGASFVTLERDGRLTGCIGSLEPRRPLWRDVALNARGAAFADPRFPPLEPGDLDGTGIKISLLSLLERLPATPDELTAALRPGVDGVLIETDGHRGTFLPSVWEKLSTPERFVAALLAKAELSPADWEAGGRAWRYTTDEFGC